MLKVSLAHTPPTQTYILTKLMVGKLLARPHVDQEADELHPTELASSDEEKMVSFVNQLEYKWRRVRPLDSKRLL